MLGGLELFLLVVSVDVVCGPLLTFVIFNPNKSRQELILDLGVVGCLQVVALFYGLHTVWVARPIYLAYEFDRFHVVTFVDLESDDWSKIPAEIDRPSFTGPKLLGVRVAKADDPDYLDQLQLSLNGQDAVFRPDRWAPYERFQEQLLGRAHEVSELKSRYAESLAEIDEAVRKTGQRPDQLKWLPVQSRRGAGWVALVDGESAQVVGWIPLDGF